MARFGDTQTSQSGAINALADRTNSGESVSTLVNQATDISATTLTTAQLINGTYILSASASTTALTYPTPADIVAAIDGCQVGSAFFFFVRNDGGGTTTMTANGLTSVEGTATMATDTANLFRGVVTVITSGAEAVEMWSLLKTAS